MEKVSVFIINYNGKNTVLKTIESIYKMQEVSLEIQVIDDGSTDGSAEIIRKSYPNIPVHKHPCNTSNLNIARNEAITGADSHKLLITDNDIFFDSQCLKKLINVMDQDESIATCTPRLMYWSEPERIYTAGTQIHYIGAAIGKYRGEIMEEINQSPSLNCGGGILLIDLSKALRVGGFDENYMMGWGDDGEFYHRLMLAGFKCLYVPTAFAYHEDKLHRIRQSRVLAQTYNRWLFILTHYSTYTIILLIPAFIIYEIMQFLFLSYKRMLFLYLKANTLVLKSLPMILSKRRKIQAMRVVSDKDVLFSGTIFVSPSLLEKTGFLKSFLELINCFFDKYWKVVKKVIS